MANFNRTKTLTKALTIDTDAYTANDVVGGLITLNFNVGYGGVIRSVQLIDDDNEDAAFTVHFFDNEPTAFLDDAAFAPVIADLIKRIGVVTIAAGNYRTDNSNSVADIHEVNYDYDTEGKTDLTIYAYLVCTGTPTYTATTDLTLRVTVWSD